MKRNRKNCRAESDSGCLLLFCLVVIVALGVGGLLKCWNDAPAVMPPQPAQITKIIASKQSLIEVRYIPVVDGYGSAVEPVTVNYLIAEDGTVLRVGIGQFGTTNVGAEVKSDKWEKK